MEAHALALAALLFAGATWAAVRGVTRFVHGVRDADDPESSLRVIRGIRGIVVSIALTSLACGIAFAQTGFVAFGLVFLVEELYETGVVALILRAQR